MLPSFELEPQCEQSEMTLDLTADVAGSDVMDDDDDDDEGGARSSVLLASGDISFGNSWSSIFSPSSLFKDRNVISAYDNFGQKKVSKRESFASLNVNVRIGFIHCSCMLSVIEF